MSHAAHIDTREKYVLGFWLYIMSDCLLFASLFATFAVLRMNTAGGADAPDLFSLTFVLIETLILLSSSFTMGLALVAKQRGNTNQVLRALVITALLGLSFVALEVQEFTQLAIEGHDWRASAFLSAFFTLVGTHGLHVSIGLIWMLVLMVQIVRKGVTQAVDRRFECLALFWHFLDIVWIFIFSLVYILPMIL